MLSKIIIFSIFLFALPASAQTGDLDIIPKPVSVERGKGEFRLTSKTKIIATDDAGRRSASILNDSLLRTYGLKLGYSERPQKENAIIFQPLASSDGPKETDAYTLTITPNAVSLAGDETGLFYAIQSLMQILPVVFEKTARLPSVKIYDRPRFEYRGMHLDVARHFFPVEFVKKYIDLMSKYKLNKFHWHLTDDQGWRIEIKKYPRLTAIGSRRPETVVGRKLNPYVGDGVPVEGFYTQDEIRDVVTYARARQVTVIPEIELPGHSSAALAAYPELGCKENYDYKVQTTWGIFKEVFCPTETTFQFFQDVLSEVIDLFPDSPYIHIGGDEVLKDHWKESAYVQELMKRENLRDEHEVQSYFVRRIEKFINSKGKKIIGWDEILEGGLAPNATVMSWRGERGGVEAAKEKHNVIMTPGNYLYFDYGQGDPQYEPVNIGNYLPLASVYSYDPQPKELSEDEKKYVIGAQANVWTEYMKTPEKVEYMAFPRMLALAEINWSPVARKDFSDFKRRLAKHYRLLDGEHVNYRIPPPAGLQNVLISDAKTITIDLKPEIPNSRILYTIDGTEPDDRSRIYEKPFTITLRPNDRVDVKAVVVNEKGRKSITYSATLLRREKLKPVDLAKKRPGVGVKFYLGVFRSVNELDAAAAAEAGETSSIQLPQFAARTGNLKQPFGAAFDGYIYAPDDAIYEFELESDDGAVLWIGDEKLVDIDGPHSPLIQTGLVPLSKGYHRVRIKYFQSGGDSALNLRWGVKGTGLRRIYGNELFH